MLLEPLEKATKYLSASSYPTMGDTRLVFGGVHAHLEKYAKDNSFAQCAVAALICCKIEEYWEIMDSASTTSAILDSRSKLTVFSNESKLSARAHIQSIYELYYSNKQYTYGFSTDRYLLSHPYTLLDILSLP